MSSADTTDTIDAVFAAVEERGLLRDAHRIILDDTGAIALEGDVLVEGQWLTLRLLLSKAFPLELPRFYLRPWDALGFIPHVEANGFVCFTDTEGLVLDRRRPVDIVRLALDLTIRVLDDGASGRNIGDFADEFGAHWARLPGGHDLRCILDPDDSVRRVLIATRKGDEPFVASDEDNLSAFFNGSSVAGKYTRQNAVYLPLEPNTILIPPRPDRPMWSAAQARQALLAGVSEANMARLRRLIKGSTAAREYVIMRLPRPSGSETLFGIRYDGVGDTHPLLEGGTADTLVPLQIERLDRSYLVRRGGGEHQLDAARVLVLGCGSVGGHIAFELARAGIQDLTLVDRDVLKAENTHRHVLGRRYWGLPKAVALATAIEQDMPYVRVNGMKGSIPDALDDGSIDVATYDLVICALGNPTIELAINERLHVRPVGPAVLFTWLEPLGIGGHSLLVADRQAVGCFECLYTSVDEIESLDNRAAFAAPGQVFGHALTGCGSLHTPYGSADAVQTTLQAVRLAVDALTRRETGNPLLSWKGDPTAFLAANFRLSPRYTTDARALYEQRYAYHSPNCRVCNASRVRG